MRIYAHITHIVMGVKIISVNDMYHDNVKYCVYSQRIFFVRLLHCLDKVLYCTVVFYETLNTDAFKFWLSLLNRIYFVSMNIDKNI